MVTSFCEPQAVDEWENPLQKCMLVPMCHAGYFDLGSPFSLAFFCFCCIISASLKGKENNLCSKFITAYICCGCSSLSLDKAVQDVTSACEQQRRDHHPSCPWYAHFASWRSSVGQVHAGFLLQKARSHPPPTIC